MGLAFVLICLNFNLDIFFNPTPKPKRNRIYLNMALPKYMLVIHITVKAV